METKKNIGRITVVLKQGDITEEAVDVIVNAANTSLLGGGGVDGAIHRKGGPAILEACQQLRARQQREGKSVGCPTGEAVMTTGGRLPSRQVIHTVGPVWRGGLHNEDELLRRSYSNSLQLASQHGAHIIAFPAISTGAYGFPIERGAKIALKGVADFALHSSSINEVRFILFTSDDFDVYQRELNRI